jgi:hypothetical protein
VHSFARALLDEGKYALAYGPLLYICFFLFRKGKVEALQILVFFRTRAFLQAEYLFQRLLEMSVGGMAADHRR